MKRKPRKLALSRETLRVLEDHALSRVGGGTTFKTCSDMCDTDFDCSTGCDHITNLWYAC